MKRFLKMLASVAIVLVALVGCKEETKKKPLLPNISGKAGEVIVVINKGEWEGALGVKVREILTQDCPYLPQKEPLYNLVDVAPNAFTNIFKIHRNILAFNIDSKVVTPGVVYRNDIWAFPQTVISVNAPTAEIALELFNENSQKILTTIEQAERDRVIINTKKYQEGALNQLVKDQFGGSIYFPSGYTLKKKTKDFVWISYETTYTQQAFFVYRYPVEDDKELSKERIVERRNQILKENVPGMFDNTYMTTNMVAGVDVQYLRFRGRDFAHTKGLWEVENDYMGGPFASHSFYSQDGQYVIVVESFVYAPKYDKRHYMRQVESLLFSWEWKEDSTKE